LKVAAVTPGSVMTSKSEVDETSVERARDKATRHLSVVATETDTKSGGGGAGAAWSGRKKAKKKVEPPHDHDSRAKGSRESRDGDSQNENSQQGFQKLRENLKVLVKDPKELAPKVEQPTVKDADLENFKLFERMRLEQAVLDQLGAFEKADERKVQAALKIYSQIRECIEPEHANDRRTGKFLNKAS
jgi:hypothetical protein